MLDRDESAALRLFIKCCCKALGLFPLLMTILFLLSLYVSLFLTAV